MIRRLLLLFSSLILAFGLTVAADRAIGLFAPNSGPGIIFPPNVTHYFQTPEFSLTVRSNSLGFRDREFTPRKTAKTRVLALGDSFTYGWGVELEQSWPKVLEAQMRESGRDVEIANLGKPGGSPRDYADIAEKAVPLLRPDLVIVAVLQGDDLAQMALPPLTALQIDKRPGISSNHNRLRAVIGRLYPHFLALVDRGEDPEPVLAEQWKQDAQTFLTVFTPDEKQHYEKLDGQVKSYFINGELNPALIYLSIHQPDYFLETMDLNTLKTRALVLKLSEQLARIKNVARQNNAEVIVVSVPYGIYVSAQSFKSRKRIGFSVVPEMLNTKTEDEATKDASRMAGVSFHEFTQEFRKASLKTDFFFDLDGHFNVAGHRYFAELLLPAMQDFPKH